MTQAVNTDGVLHPVPCADVAAVRAQIGQEIYRSDWLAFDQARIDRFAEATGDFQWIHVDTARAAQHSPYGGTIAHGFLTLSILGQFYEEFLPDWLPFCHLGLNYGLNKVRFMQPVRTGSRVRARFVLQQVEEVGGGLQFVFQASVQIEGVDKPACVAESVVRRQFRVGSGA